MALSHVVSEILNVEKYLDLKFPVRGHCKVIDSGTIRKIGQTDGIIL